MATATHQGVALLLGGFDLCVPIRARTVELVGTARYVGRRGWCDLSGLGREWGGTPPPLPEGAIRLAPDPSRSGELVPADD